MIMHLTQNPICAMIPCMMDRNQLIALLDLLLAQQKDILELKASTIALTRIACELGGDGVPQRLTQLRQEVIDSNTLHGTRAAIEAFQKLLDELTPPPASLSTVN